MAKDSEMIEKIVYLNKNFEKMSNTEKKKWFENIGDIKVEHFYKANQKVFEEVGAREFEDDGEKEKRREFLLGVLKNKVESEPLNFEEGHPISNYIKENIVIRDLCEQIAEVSKCINFNNCKNPLDLLNELYKVDIHYLRKEDQLFPYLEKYDFTYPSTGMWKFHDEMRAGLKTVIKAFEEGKVTKEISTLLDSVLKDIYDMTTREEKMLLPTAVSLLTEQEWIKMSEDEKRIGYVFIENPPIWPKKQNQFNMKFSNTPLGILPIQDGFLSKEQLELFFSHIPFDVTIIDENDRVIFFNNGPERTFLRTPAVIGREVKYCHPPKSVDKVLRILEAFKDGSKDSAQFWINFKSRLIHIRYFALRDENKNYKGILEITQDVTDIQKLEGEKRILDWED